MLRPSIDAVAAVLLILVIKSSQGSGQDETLGTLREKNCLQSVQLIQLRYAESR